MLQKEVVDRLTAVPGNKDYGRLSVMVQAQCSALRLFVVKPGAFNPPPKVDSAIVRLIPDKKRMSDIKSMSIMQKVVQQAFSQRRKTLRNTLKGLISVQQLEKLGIDPQKRPETLTVEQYIALSNLCCT
jgi:16S rRNA (adenine1518-N6/adenine1519-N6)-dimethyltransferase